jgi:hypothetical protein
VRACSAALELVTCGAASAPAGRGARLRLEASGALAGPAAVPSRVQQGALCGLLRTAAAEHAAVRVVAVQLDAGARARAPAPGGRAEHPPTAAGAQLAWRCGAACLARLLVASSGEACEQLQIAPPTAAERGAIDGLAAAPWAAPLARSPSGAPGALEVRVMAVGLNFRDLLIVLGMHPGDAVALGSDCACVVVGGQSAGVRRVEAVAGPGLVELLGARDSLVQGLAQQLRVQPDRLAARVAAMADDQRRLSAEVEQLKAALAVARCEALLPSALRLPGGALLLVRQLDGLEAAPLAAAAQHLHAQLGPGPTAVVLGSAAPDARVCLVAALSPDAVARGASAGALLAQLAKLCGGGGGGKPAFAQAGGKDAAALPAALDTAVKQLTAQLSAPAAV